MKNKSKRLIICFLLATAVLLGFAGCEGPVGPAGKDGTNGTNGKDGLNGSNTSGFTLTPTITVGGTISPSVPVQVDSGDLHLFVVKPAVFYRLDSVTADGVRLPVSAGSLGSTVYVLDVSKDMTIKAWFSRRPVYYGMKLIPGGTFLMGSDSTFVTAGIVNWMGDTVHQVTVSSFYMDSTEVTQAEYRGLMGVNPAHFRNGTGWAMLPVESVTWFDAVLYCNARSKTEGKDTVYTYSYVDGTPGNGCLGLLDIATDYTKKGYRLPTEAEWEYACRGGTTTTYWWGADTNGVDARAWTYYNSNSTTHPAATKLANAYGLYDMTGNVWEWNNDWYGKYGSGSQTNPTGAAAGDFRGRGVRGGDFQVYVEYLRSALRNFNSPDYHYNPPYGFRVVLPAQ